MHIVPLDGAATGWHWAHTEALPTLVCRWLLPPPSQPDLACGALQPWQPELTRQDWPEEPPLSDEPWQPSQYEKPEELPGAALAVAPCWFPASHPEEWPELAPWQRVLLKQPGVPEDFWWHCAQTDAFPSLVVR